MEDYEKIRKDKDFVNFGIAYLKRLILLLYIIFYIFLLIYYFSNLFIYCFPFIY